MHGLRPIKRFAAGTFAGVLLLCAMDAAVLAQATAVSIVQGTVGMVGGSSVGVSATYRHPAAAADTSSAGKTVNVSLDRYARDVPVEFSLPLQEGNLLPAADGMHRIERIDLPAGGARGAVSIAAHPASAAAASGSTTAYLARGGWLRLNGPETDGALDMAIDALNGASPAPSADVYWWPSQFALEDADTRTVWRAHLVPGKRLTLVGLALTVAAIEPATGDHPAWIRFEVVRSR